MFSKNQHNSFFGRKPSFDVLVHYHEGDMTDAEKAFVHQRLEESEEWQREYQKTIHFLAGLHSLPLKTPPNRVWEAVLESVKKSQQNKIWFPWFYASPVWPRILRGATACVVVLLTTVCLWISTNNSQHIIVVEDNNGFGLEADSYVIHHDLSREAAIAGETIVASYYNSDRSE